MDVPACKNNKNEAADNNKLLICICVYTMIVLKNAQSSSFYVSYVYLSSSFLVYRSVTSG